MPNHRDRYYDIRLRRPGFTWMAFSSDQITPIGRGDARTKENARSAAIACIDEVLDQPAPESRT